MGYIRTKYDSILKIYADRGSLLECENGKNLIISLKKDIIKQADTIEELCDEFVFITDNLLSGGYWVIRTYKRAKEIAQSYKEDKINFNCYGAIWTDKGLIYVAKMNEKGELELL